MAELQFGFFLAKSALTSCFHRKGESERGDYTDSKLRGQSNYWSSRISRVCLMQLLYSLARTHLGRRAEAQISSPT